MPKRPNIGEMDVWKQLGTPTEEAPVQAYKDAKLIEIGLVRPNPDQPRKTYDPEALRELAESIRERGLLQPIVVRSEDEGFIIIAGQRRYEACRLIGMAQIAAVVREATEQEALEESLIENVQREDINPVEEALCYRKLMDEHGYSIRAMAGKVRKSVGYLHGRLELLKHADVAAKVSQKQLGVFEARELAKIEDEAIRGELAQKVAAGQLDRAALRSEVRKVTAEPRQLPLFDTQAFSRRWGKLHKELEAVGAAKLGASERQEACQLLEEMRQAIEELLSRME